MLSKDEQEAFESQFAALRAAADPDHAPEPEDWLKAAEDIASCGESSTTTRAAELAAQVARWYGQFAHGTRLGHWVHRHAFDREQF